MIPQAIQPNMAANPRIGQLQPARFSGLADGLANMIGKVDSSKILELATTDILGMGIPRTAIEQVKRGPDAAREEAIRNFSATFTNVFLAGVYSYLFIKLFGRTKFYNPKGIPPTAFINAESLSAFGRMTEAILAKENITTPEMAKKAFYKRALAGLQSGDHLLGQADFAKASAEAGLEKGVAYSAKLDGKVIDELVEKLDLDDVKRAELVKDAKIKPTLMERLHLKKPNVSTAFYESVIEPKTITGLSEKVNLVDDKALTHITGRNRRQLVKEIGYFGEHFLGRAFEGAENNTAWKESAIERLTKKCSSLFLPKAGDGLIPYALKSKLMYTKWPIFLTLVTSVSVAFFNNWLTKRKHGGVNFFPGEGGPVPQGQQGPQMAAPTFPAGSLTRRPNVFAQFDLKNPQPQQSSQIPPELLAQLMGGGQPPAASPMGMGGGV